jgi:transcriptional regulator with XRE-family HTH domain
MVKRRPDDRIAARLIEARKARGFSQGWLAKRIGVSVGTIQAYEHGRSRIPASRLAQMASVLDWEPGKLLTF